jgi:outer membrane protein assembly factor BamB/predicted phosphodiesterase
MKHLLLFVCLLIAGSINAQRKSFRFAFISDTHIGSPNGAAEEDLRRTIRDINSMKDVAFVVITGDITELGTDEELQLAKRIFDSLHIPYYIIPGNHDTGWSESGGAMFTTVFGYDKFSFEYEGIRFLGCPSGPYVRMSDGHVPRSAVNWLDEELKTIKPQQPVIFLNHYPIDNGLDNWYEITDRFRKYNTWAILCGHGHSNRAMKFEDIPGVMGRSNLRAKAAVGGYNLVDVRSDSILFTERRPGVETLKTWTGIKIETHQYDAGKKFPRPDYSMNEKQKGITATSFSEPANVISTAAVSGDYIVSGNQAGEVVARRNGKIAWKYVTGGAIFSSPAVEGNKVIIGSADSSIYCLGLKTGKLQWKKTTGAAVLGSALIHGDTAFIGGSDHSYLALSIASGNTIWKFDGLDGPVVSKPLLYDGKLIFGAWDRHLYAVNCKSGALLWKWNNGSTVRNYSPASCIPVAADGVVYIVAPDRYITALDANTGTALWRNNDGGVRESIGISADGKWIYGKSMQDTIVVYAASRDKQWAAWKMHCGFGYEHVPSMLIEKEGKVYFGTRNGVVYCIDPKEKKIIWQYKIDNSMVNTVNVMSSKRVVAATMDGKIADIRIKSPTP